MEQGIDVTSGVPILECTVVTPEKAVLQTPAQFIALPLFDGEIGIAPHHSPMIGRLGFGEMRIREGGKERRYYVDGGFVQVVGNDVTVLTNRAIPAAEINPEAAQAQLDEALKRPIDTEELLAIRDRLIAQARAQLRVARRAA